MAEVVWAERHLAISAATNYIALDNTRLVPPLLLINTKDHQPKCQRAFADDAGEEDVGGERCCE